MSLTSAVILLTAIVLVGFLIRCHRDYERWRRGLTPLQRWEFDQDEREQDRIY